MMNQFQRKKLSGLAWKKWGIELQMGMLTEECAELIQAINKLKRDESQKNWKQFAEEIADVEIMIEQMKFRLDYQRIEERVAEAKEVKLKRLKQILKNE